MKDPKNIEIARLMHDTAKLIRTDFERRGKRFCQGGECGVTRSQFQALISVKHREGCTQAELATDLDLKPISLARLLDRMEDLIERRPDPRDKRLKRLYLTKQAWERLGTFKPIIEETMKHAIAGIAQADIQFAIRVLGKIKENTANQLKLMEEENDND